jgi:hypothetical protein
VCVRYTKDAKCLTAKISSPALRGYIGNIEIEWYEPALDWLYCENLSPSTDPANEKYHRESCVPSGGTFREYQGYN